MSGRGEPWGGLRAPPRRARPLLDAFVVVGPGLVALALCLLELAARSLWLDEAATVSIASQHGAALGAALARDGGNMLGYYGLMHVLIGAFGNGPEAIRLPSAVAGAFTALLTAAIALRLWGRVAAAAAGLLTAVSLSLVYWSQVARGYAVMIALIAGSFLAFVWLLEADRRRAAAWLAYVASSTAAVYAGLEAALVIPAQLVILYWRPRRARSALAAVATTALCCVPLGVLAAQRGSGQIFWIPAPSLRTAKQVLQALTSSGLQPAFYTATGDALLILTLVLIVGFGVQLAAAPSWRGGRCVGGHVLIASWLVVPIALVLVVSVAAHSIFQARYVLVCLPAVALALAGTLSAAPLPRLVSAALLAALLALRAVQLVPSYGTSTEYWRGATAYVAQHASAADCLAFYPLDTRMPFEYYGGHSGRLPPSVLPAVPWGRVRPNVERYATLSSPALASLPTGCSRIWLIWSHEGRLGGPPISGANFRRLQTLRGELERRYPQTTLKKLGGSSPIFVDLLAR